ARAAAVADARRKAELYADAADVDLGDVVSISEFSASGPVPVVRMEAAMAVPIAAGRNEISASVMVVWELD
ncbi:MAG: SIMPL domain-containing protein, partial [Pseudomonadota bacterium]